jgi:hypothetical protein
MDSSLEPVSEKRGLEVLRRIQRFNLQDIQPSVRDSGLSGAEARWMAQNGLITLGDTMAWQQAAQETTPFEDRFVIPEITDKAKICLTDAADLDPFRVVVSFCSQTNNADLFLDVFIGAGLVFDASLVGADNFSHGNRIRALRPRVLSAYDSLNSEAKLAVANAAISRFIILTERLPAISVQMVEALAKIGWAVRDKILVAAEPQIREIFFPKGSQWDAFVAIREFIDKAKASLLLIDPYCDREFFGLLQSSAARPLNVRLLCRNNPGGLKAEAKAFMSQYCHVKVELRTSSDFHDRFLIVDETVCIHIGASINHAGSRGFMISQIEDASNRHILLQASEDAWRKGAPV